MSVSAPFPYFGGKRTVAPIVWQRLGDVPNYVEPFFGSGAVLLARPHPNRVVTVNDADGLLVNAWRAMAYAPAETAVWADWPVSEADLAARHWWLLTEGRERIARVINRPDGFDAQAAGWWIWGTCCWIGSGWCSGDGPWSVGPEGEWIDARQLPHVGDAGRGIKRKLPHVGDAGRGINRKLPHVGDAGQGINRKLPHVGNAGRGINRKLPHVGDAGQGEKIAAYFEQIAAKLRGVRICHGDFERVLRESVTTRHGLTGVFLDPPYISDCADVYTHSDSEPARRAQAWCLANGDNPLLRIALCGYSGEHDALSAAGWQEWRWKARGGYGSHGEGIGRANAARETVWFSPHCLGSSPCLFDLAGTVAP